MSETEETERRELKTEFHLILQDPTCLVLAANFGPGCLVRVIEMRPTEATRHLEAGDWTMETYGSSAVFIPGMSVDTGNERKGPSVVVPGPGFGRRDGGPEM